jgi:hypothetical protein
MTSPPLMLATLPLGSHSIWLDQALLLVSFLRNKHNKVWEHSLHQTTHQWWCCMIQHVVVNIHPSFQVADSTLIR